ncbi:MAG: 50S ribosomal protein L13 [Candidatus Latescibacteria bacterium]|jgi:large subunit ribosomal protein L13|nr:50S ribosomal protein L13 [Candidatus Latescibacterota bacterium]
MDTMSAKASEIDRKWYVADASGKILGRFATEVARILRGKHKPIYTPHVDTGDHVVVVNAEKIRVTGDKLEDKEYTSYSGYPSGLKRRSLKHVLETRPEFVLQHAIKGMLPKNKLGRKMLKKLRVYAGPDHPHQGQAPEDLDI